MPCDVYILGSGAMGCLWARYLFPTNHVTFIQKQTQTNRFQFQYLPDDISVNVKCTNIQDINAPIEHLILATKAYDAFNAMEQVSPYLAAQAQVVLLQNGLGSQQAIAKAWPNLSVFASSSTEGAYKPDSNTLIHAGKGVNKIGPLTHHAQLKQLSKWLPDDCYQWDTEIEAVLWQKFMVNCAINPLTQLYDCANGTLLDNPDFFSHMKRICQEIDQITQAKGFQLPSAFQLAQQVCQVTANNFSSMLQDARNHRMTEIEFMTGYLLRQGMELNIDCPHNLALYDSITGG